jgi:hypothetical protein
VSGIARLVHGWHAWGVAVETSNCVVYRISPHDGRRRFSGDGLGFTLRFTSEGTEFDFEPEAGRALDTISCNVAGYACDADEPVFHAAGPIVVTDRLVLGCLIKPARTDIDDVIDDFITCDDEEYLEEYILFAVKGHAVHRLVNATRRHRLSSVVVLMQLLFPADNPDELCKLELDRTDDKRGKFFKGLVRGIGMAHLRELSGDEDDTAQLLRVLKDSESTLLAERNGLVYRAFDFAPS